MAITKRMFVICTGDREREPMYRDVSVDALHYDRNALEDLMTVAVAQSRAAAAVGVLAFTHTYDPELASAHLREVFRYTEQEIDMMPPQRQCEVVTEVWKSLGRYFQAMNIRPYALAAVRRVMAYAWGGPPYGDQQETDQRDVVVDRSVYMTWSWPGAWRNTASQRFASGGHATRDPRTVIFGSQDDNDGTDIDNTFGCSAANTSPNDDCPMPAEIHRLFLQNNGRVTTTWIHTPDELRAAGGVLDDDGTDMDFTDMPFGDEPEHREFWGWRFMAWEDSTPAIGRDRLYYLPSLHQYWSMLLRPTPGLKLDGAGPDLSLAEYLYKLGPAQVARTGQRDVISKNMLMLQVRGRHSLSELDDILGDSGASDARELQQDIAQVEAVGQMLLTAAAPLAVKFPVGTVAAVVLGIAGAVASFAPELFVTERRHIDVPGRIMAAVEVFAQRPGEAAISYLESLTAPTPAGIPGWYDGRAPEGSAVPVLATDPRLPGPAPAEPLSAPPAVASPDGAAPTGTGLIPQRSTEDRRLVVGVRRVVTPRGAAAAGVLTLAGGVLAFLAVRALQRRRAAPPADRALPPAATPRT